MKVKKLVAVLLAALLLVGMIPMNAFALTSDVEDAGQVTLMISDSFGGSVKGANGTVSIAATSTRTVTASYNNMSASNKGKLYHALEDEDSGEEIILTETQAKENMGYASAAYSPAAGGEIEVAAGSTVYLGIKYGAANKKNAIGAYPAGAIFIQFDGTKFEAPSLGTYTDNIAINHVASGINETVGKNTADRGRLLMMYGGDWGINKTASSIGGGTTAESFLGITLSTSQKAYMIATETPWDLVIPMVVKEGATGTGTFKVVEAESINSTPSTMQVVTSAVDGSTNLTVQNINAKNDHNIVSNDVTVKIKVTTPGLDLVDETVPSGSATIKVKLNEFAKAGSKVGDTGYWEVKSNGNAATVTGVSGPDGDGIITLTVTGLQAGSVEVTAKAGALASTSGTDTQTDFTLTGITAVDAPTGTIACDTGIVTVSAQNVSIKIKGTNNWIDLGTSTTHTLTAAELTALNNAVADGVTMADAIEVALTSDKTVKSNISVTRGGVPAEPTIDYEAETVTAAATVEYKYGTKGYDQTTNDLEPGQNITYRTKATAGALASSEKTLTVPARPTLTVTAAADENVEKQGKTKLNITGTGAIYSKTDSTVATGTALTAEVELAVGETLYAKIPASNTSKNFASAVATVQGKGWNWSEVGPASISLTAGDPQTISLTKTGPIAWAGTAGVGDFGITAVTNGAAALTVTGFTPTATGADLTISGEPTKGAQYTLTVKTTAITGEALNNPKKDTTITLNAPADDAQPITVPGYDYTGQVSKNGTVEIDLTAKLVGKKITGVTSSDTTLVTATPSADGKKLNVTGTDKISGKPDGKTAVELTIEVEIIPLQYTGASVELNDETDVKTLNPTNAADLAGVTVTVTPKNGAPADGLTVDSGLTLKTSGDKFQTKGTYTYTVEGSNGASVDVTITVTGIAATPDFSGMEKKWDNTTDLTKNLTPGKDTVKWTDKNGVELTGTYSGTYKLNDPAVGTTANVDVAEGTFTTTDGTEYDVAAGTYDVTVVAAEIESIEVGTPSAKEGTIESVADQLGNTTVTVTTDSGVTVEKKLSDLVDPEDIAAAIKEQLQDAADAEAAEAAVAKVLADAVKAYEAETGEKAVDEDGEYTDEFAAWVETATNDDGDTWEKALDDAAATTADEVTSVKAGTELDVSGLVDADAIAAMIDADDTLKGNVNAPSDASSVDDSSLNEITVTKKSTPSGPSAPNVNLETNGFATPDGPVELDEDGKITKLPGVIGQKLGSVFKGWATQAGNPNTIVKEGREITGDTTLYGIFEGYMNGDYNASNQRTARPGDPVTRGELLTMLVRAAGIYDDSVDYSTTFADAQGAWYTAYVGCAEEAGILAGDKEGTARPKDYITREEAAIFIAKTFNVTVPEGGTTEYVVDFDDTATWAKDYVAALVNNGTSVGNDKQEYEPKKNITRAEVAAMINKYLGLSQAKKTALSGSATSPFVDVQNANSWYYAEMIFASLNAPDNYYVTEVTYPSR